MTALLDALRAYLCSNAVRFGLSAATPTIEPILNWGGFHNTSFRVTDGSRRLHVKVSREQQRLRAFLAASAVLHARYHCPAVVAWIDVPETGFGGLVFEFVDGASPVVVPETLIGELGLLLTRLHVDAELRSLLAGGPKRCAETYLDIYDRRFCAGLTIIARSPPPFVVPATLSFMTGEAQGLSRHVRTAPEFAIAADAPIHGDIWENNILVEDTGAWALIDWDNLRIGDAALDWAMTSGMAQVRAPDENAPYGVAVDAATLMRIQHYRRAMQLDRVIDVLADWVTAAEHPDWTDAVRSKKEADHVQALARYRVLYAS